MKSKCNEDFEILSLMLIIVIVSFFLTIDSQWLLMFYYDTSLPFHGQNVLRIFYYSGNLNE